ncbi:hypothetical protein NCWK1_2045 [Nostoc cycadae WK-1]|uniref:Uncharacterized protein n=1 Tax=Nostoc cycadae WK-1 TaxID=1861711 RepID=A0A2H6LGE6_9NOSO|nr:hypothetical protein NCWK1_2045 [Nostoc cycadae WK-1]
MTIPTINATASDKVSDGFGAASVVAKPSSNLYFSFLFTWTPARLLNVTSNVMEENINYFLWLRINVTGK